MAFTNALTSNPDGTIEVNKGLRDIPIERIEDESLDIKPYIDSLSQFIMECDTPMTIAIQGDWGSGKTSMMNLIQATIEEKYPGKICPIWFNTWQYSQFNARDQLGTSLLTRFVNEISGESNMGEQAMRMLGAVAKIAARNVAFIGAMAVTGSAEGAKDAQEAVDTVLQKDVVQSLTDLKKSIIKITQERLTTDKKDRVVVFIDDLDRLVPARAVDLLEVFKLFLDVPGCVFVLACDYQVIAQGLKEKFGLGENDLKGKSFFDKIIQLPFSMPVSQYDTRAYTNDLLNKIGISPKETEFDVYRNLIKHSVGLNPRSMKRLFNSFQLISLAAQNKGILKDTTAAKREERQRILLACLCLQTAFEPVYRHLVSKGSALSEKDLQELSGLDPEDASDLNMLLEEMGGAKSLMVRRLPEFMEAFIASIQLDSDGTDKLTANELHNMAEILGFSSITSTASMDSSKEDNQQARKALKKSLLKICADVNENCLAKLKYFRPRLVLWRMGRTSNLYGEICTDSSFKVKGHEIWPGFLFDARTENAISRTYIQIVSNNSVGDKFNATRDFLIESLSKQFLGAHVEGELLILKETGHSPISSLEDRLADFEEEACKCADLLFSRLAALK